MQGGGNHLFFINYCGMIILLVVLLLFCVPCGSYAGDNTQNAITLLQKDDVKSREAVASFSSYDKDGRTQIIKLYKSHLQLVRQHGWKMEELFTDKIVAKDGITRALPSTVLTSPRKGPALWILTGIHGEEPAGPCALAENMEFLAALCDREVPMVIFPLLNPGGYYRNLRYPGAEARGNKAPEISVGDSDHLLPDKSGKPRKARPSSARCDSVTRKVLELSKDYPPLLVLDFHEDDTVDKGYIYSQGKMGRRDPTALAIIGAFKEMRFPLLLSGRISDEEIIKDGIISDVKDGSIDELLASTEILRGGTKYPGPSAESAIVIETGSLNVSLPSRIKVHSHILRMAETLWKSVLH